MKRIYLILGLVALVFAGAGSGDKFPDFTLENIDGDDVSLEQMLGEKPVVITFWATWCKPCVKELKAFKPIYEEMKDDFHFIAINEDGPRSRGKVKPFAKKEGFEYTILYDNNGEVKMKAGVSDIPHFFLLDKSGNIVYKHPGYKTGDEKESVEAIKDLLKTSSCSDTELAPEEADE